MTMLKEPSRPINQHRSSFSSSQSILPRNSLPRSHGYSTSMGTLNPAHRVTRRKSSNLSPAAITAAVQALEAHEDGKPGNRRSFQSRIALGSLNPIGLQSPPNSLPGTSMLASKGDSAIIDGPPLSSISETPNNKNRIRRASDGSALGSSKKKPGNGELKCETCGKGYKHSSCLTKHLWEHTPEWSITSKLLISKHQQVQLLEAASVLVAMNQEGEASRSSDSEQSYTSPAASGFSDREGSVSSIETTPPPHGDYPYGHRKRVSNASSAFSRSYQSVFSSGPYQHQRQWSTSSNRPGTAQTALTESYPGEDQADLAAAVGLLSCSYGTPQTGPVSMPADVPPVPPLPEKYQSLPRSSYQREVDMDDVSSSEDDRSQRHSSRHEEDDRIFGEMDE